MKLEVISAIVLIALGVLILNPLHFWMPTMAHMAMLAAAIVTFGIFSVFVLRENARDERDDAHRMFAGRTAFLFGGGVLLLGIVAQSLQDALDPWLVAALVVMVLAKISMRIYSNQYL